VLGCNNLGLGSRSAQQAPGLRITSAMPTAPELVASLNESARLVQALECRDVDLDCQQGHQPIGLRAMMVCQKPRNFRMVAKIMGNTAADMGSNSQEFWFWVSKNDPPYLFHCSYQDYGTGQVRLPFPFQPDWITEALGIAEYDPSRQYEVVGKGPTLDLVEQAVSAQGQPVRKVTRLSNNRGRWQVTAHILQDVQGHDICTAFVSELQQDPATGALVSRVVRMEWPAQQMKMRMRLEHVTVNPQLPPDRVVALFSRPTLHDVPGYDLARGTLDAPSGGLRAAGGFAR
jgi:hypothetical protein